MYVFEASRTDKAKISFNFFLHRDSSDREIYGKLIGGIKFKVPFFCVVNILSFWSGITRNVGTEENGQYKSITSLYEKD